MVDDHHLLQTRPAWEKVKLNRKPDPTQCNALHHMWMARFYVSGLLAYWVCANCGKMDRVMTRLPEYLDNINGWIDSPPRLIARGFNPPVPDRTQKWIIPEGTLLHECEPSSIYHVGLEIPDLTEAHTYHNSNADGSVIEIYEPSRERLGKHSDHYWLTRYQVIGSELVRFISHCFEESTYDAPSTQKPKLKTILSGLHSLPKQLVRN